MSQNDPKTTSFMMSIQNYFIYDVNHKNLQPPTKKNFLVQSRRLADPFQPFSSSLAQIGVF